MFFVHLFVIHIVHDGDPEWNLQCLLTKQKNEKMKKKKKCIQLTITSQFVVQWNHPRISDKWSAINFTLVRKSLGGWWPLCLQYSVVDSRQRIFHECHRQCPFNIPEGNKPVLLQCCEVIILVLKRKYPISYNRVFVPEEVKRTCTWDQFRLLHKVDVLNLSNWNVNFIIIIKIISSSTVPIP